jgi:hypothetical protein
MLRWGAFGTTGGSIPKEAVVSGLRLEADFVVFAPALVGLVLGLVVLSAPLFGRTREGTVYAGLAVCLSLFLLGLVLTHMSAK